MNEITLTGQWFYEANQQPAEPTPDVRQSAFYAGMQLEELGEKLSVISEPIGKMLKAYGNSFKQGNFDDRVAEAFKDPAKVKEMLDGDVDLVWVSIGAARAQGADFAGAYAAVNTVNWKKKFEDGKFHNDPTTNKVLKPEGWTAADLSKFIHPTLRGYATGGVIEGGGDHRIGE